MLRLLIHWGMKMSVTLELLEALKASQGNCSDYRAAKILGVAQPQICKYRSGERPLSPEKVLFICEMVGLDGVDWLLKLYRERAKCDSEKKALDGLRSRMAA